MLILEDDKTILSRLKIVRARLGGVQCTTIITDRVGDSSTLPPPIENVGFSIQPQSLVNFDRLLIFTIVHLTGLEYALAIFDLL